jgi:hypothetical protein
VRQLLIEYRFWPCMQTAKMPYPTGGFKNSKLLTSPEKVTPRQREEPHSRIPTSAVFDLTVFS